MLPERENSFDYGPQRSDESNESYKKRIESALEPPQSPDYGPPKSTSDEEQQKKAQGKPVEDNVKVINIDKADTSSSEQLIGEDLSSKIPELETESSEKSREEDLDLQVGGEMTSVDLDELFK